MIVTILFRFFSFYIMTVFLFQDAFNFHKLFGVFLYQKCVFSAPFIYLFNHLCIFVQYRLMHFFFYFELYFNISLFYYSIVPPLAIERCFCWLLCLFQIPSIQTVFICFLITFLLSVSTKYSNLSMYIFHSSLRVCHSLKESSIFCWRMVLETIICTKCTLCFCQVVALAQETEQRKLCVHTNICIYTHL